MDLVVGADLDDDGGISAGAAYVIFLGDAVAPGGVSDGLEAWFDASHPEVLFEQADCDDALEGGSEEIVGCWKDRSDQMRLQCRILLLLI